MTEHNNPTVFPIKQPLSNDFLGMSLLDHFAGLAMQAGINDSSLRPAYSFEDMADRAYRMADAMLKERDKWIK